MRDTQPTHDQQRLLSAADRLDQLSRRIRRCVAERSGAPLRDAQQTELAGLAYDLLRGLEDVGLVDGASYADRQLELGASWEAAAELSLDQRLALWASISTTERQLELPALRLH